MKKLNESPTIKIDHKGSHLTNADGEVVQSFAKDRAGLKDARQAMYKNYKGLNRKTPAPEPVEEPVEEGIRDDVAQIKQQQSGDPRDQMARYNSILNRNPKQSHQAIKQNQQTFDADSDTEYDWDKPAQFNKPTQRQLDLNKQAKTSKANFASNINEDSYSEYAELAKRNNANTYEQIMELLSQQGLSEEEMYNVADYIMNSLDGISESITEGFAVRLSNGGRVPIGDYEFTYHVNNPSKANMVARSAENRGMTVKDIDSEDVLISGNANTHNSLVRSLQSLHINGYITEDKKMSALENKLKAQLAEGITVNTTSTNDENIEDNVTVTATGADAMELVQMLKMAGIGAPKAQEVEAPAEEMPCMSQPNEIDSMRDMISNMDNVGVIALDDIEAVEEEAELANAPDEKYADTDTLVNKISGGLNRRKKAYAKAENGDNPMAVTESEEELTTRLLKEYDEFKVTAPADSEEGNWEIENVGKWAVKIGNTENVDATDGELDLPFDTDLASALADEAMAEAEDTDLVEDDVEEGLRMEFPDGSCEGSKCPDDRNRRKKPKKLDTDTDALDDEMSEDKK